MKPSLIGTALLAMMLLNASTARAATDRIALLQLDAYFSDARNEAIVVREAADRLARATNPEKDTTWIALDQAVTNLSRQVAAIRQKGAPPKFADVAVAAEDVSRDQQALRASLVARDGRAIREDAAHLLQALGRIDDSLDEVSAETHFPRLQFLRLSGAVSR